MAGLGRSYHLIGDYDRAARFAERALQLYRAMGSGAEVAKVLTALGDTRLAAGDRDAADSCFRTALVILDELRLPQADDLRERLARLNEQAEAAKSQGIRPGATVPGGTVPGGTVPGNTVPLSSATPALSS